MKKLLVLLAILTTLGLGSTVLAAQDDKPDNKPSVCHPVNGKGELGNGWNLIAPAQASSHIDESKYPSGEYWKHTSKDGRHDQYAINETCPSDQPYVPTTCPAGYDDIGKEENGDAICKLQPTGCPYGDSIPLGPACDKQKPVVENPTPTPVETEETEVFYGK